MVCGDGMVRAGLVVCLVGLLCVPLISVFPVGMFGVGMVMAQEGYPGSYGKGAVISGIDAAEGLGEVVVFHAGTKRGEGGEVIVAGGRVLGVTARGRDLAAARTRAYEAVERIRWEGAYWRRDIGNRGLDRGNA